MKISVCLFGLLILGSVCFADVFDSPLNTESEAEFKALTERTSRNNVTKGDFTQIKSISSLNRQIRSFGTFVISNSDGMVWNTQKPFPSVMVLTDKAVTQISASGKKTVVAESGNSAFTQFSTVLSAVFNGDHDILVKNFHVYFVQKGQVWFVGLVPKDSSLRAFVTKIEMEGQDSIKKVLLHEATGDSVCYEFSNVMFAQELTSDELAYFR